MSKLIVSKICGKMIGIPSSEVKEIVELQKVSKSPFSFPFVIGTTFFRGSILTIVTLSYFINDECDSSSNIAIRFSRYDNLLLVINSVEGCIDYNELKLLKQGDGALYLGLYPFEEIFITVLNVQNFVSLLEEETINIVRYGSSGR